MSIVIPPALDWLRRSESGQAWLHGLPALVEECSQPWSLHVGNPYDDSYESSVLPAIRADATAVVLKVQFLHGESTHEAAALACCNGLGSVRLLAHDPD